MNGWSGVGIAGMKMPASCDECRFYYGYGCHVGGRYAGRIADTMNPSVVPAESGKCRGNGCPLARIVFEMPVESDDVPAGPGSVVPWEDKDHYADV